MTSNKHWQRVLLVGAALAIVLLVFAACGDDDEEAPGTPAPTPDNGDVTPRPDDDLEADPELLERSLGTTENIDPLVERAIARAGIELTSEERELALRCWRDHTCDTGRGNLTVALADGFGENVWRRITHMEFVLQALSYPDVARIIYVSALGDSAKALSDMRSLIAQNVDIIATFPDSGEALLPAIREATQASIIVVPYIASAGGTAGQDYLTFVAEDLCELGEQFAEFSIEEEGEGGNAVLLGGTPGNLLSAAWQECAEPVLQDAGWNILGRADTNWTQEGTFTAMSGFLATHGGDIDAILYEYSDGFRGGVRAYESANIPPDVVLTLRTDEQGLFCDWEEIGDPSFRIFFSTGGTFQSRIALTAAMESHNGEDIPDRVVVPFRMRQVEEGMCDPNLPEDAPVSSVVPEDLLREMFQ